MQFNRLIIFVSFWLAGQSVLSQGYEPPRTESGKPDLQGYWTNASITTMQRSRELADFGLTIPFDEVARLTNNNHQNVRQATDDNQVQGRMISTSIAVRFDLRRLTSNHKLRLGK